GGLLREDERGVGAVAPTNEGGSGDAEGVEHCAGVGRHQLVGIGAVVARRAALAPGVDNDGLVAGGNERRDLVAEIAAVAETAVKQDDRRPVAEAGVPDAGILVVG